MKWMARYLRDLDAWLAISAAGVGFVVAILRNFGLFNDRIFQTLVVTTLTGLASSIYRDRRNNAAARTEQIFSAQGHAYQQLIEYVEKHDIDRAIFLQYSGQKSMDVLEAVLKKKEAETELFIQTREFAKRIGSARQEKLITGAIDTLRQRNKEVPNSSTFNVYQFDSPASMRAILIDRKILCIGWYTVELGRGGQQSDPDDLISVSGHDRPTMVLRPGTDLFEVLSDMVVNLANNLKQEAAEVTL
jgi:hypothetical protein